MTPEAAVYKMVVRSWGQHGQMLPVWNVPLLAEEHAAFAIWFLSYRLKVMEVKRISLWAQAHSNKFYFSTSSRFVCVAAWQCHEQNKTFWGSMCWERLCAYGAAVGSSGASEAHSAGGQRLVSQSGWWWPGTTLCSCKCCLPAVWRGDCTCVGSLWPRRDHVVHLSSYQYYLLGRACMVNWE